jgi:hypothetical protein
MQAETLISHGIHVGLLSMDHTYDMTSDASGHQELLLLLMLCTHSVVVQSQRQQQWALGSPCLSEEGLWWGGPLQVPSQTPEARALQSLEEQQDGISSDEFERPTQHSDYEESSHDYYSEEDEGACIVIMPCNVVHYEVPRWSKTLHPVLLHLLRWITLPFVSACLALLIDMQQTLCTALLSPHQTFGHSELRQGLGSTRSYLAIYGISEPVDVGYTKIA